MVELKKTILVVDDVEDWQKTLSGLLADEGYTVVAVGDREAALKAVKTHKFDLAVIDIRLDEADEDNTAGLSLAHEIKLEQMGLPIVIITGYETTESISQAMRPDQTGRPLAIDFVLKADMDELVDIVNTKLGSSQITIP
jgi:CheY-like chemotaxis protein